MGSFRVAITTFKSFYGFCFWVSWDWHQNNEKMYQEWIDFGPTILGACGWSLLGRELLQASYIENSIYIVPMLPLPRLWSSQKAPKFLESILANGAFCTHSRAPRNMGTTRMSLGDVGSGFCATRFKTLLQQVHSPLFFANLVLKVVGFS